MKLLLKSLQLIKLNSSGKKEIMITYLISPTTTPLNHPASLSLVLRYFPDVYSMRKFHQLLTGPGWWWFHNPYSGWKMKVRFFMQLRDNCSKHSQAGITLNKTLWSDQWLRHLSQVSTPLSALKMFKLLFLLAISLVSAQQEKER